MAWPWPLGPAATRRPGTVLLGTRIALPGHVRYSLGMIKQIGFALTAGILIDGFLVRMTRPGTYGDLQRQSMVAAP